MTIFATDIVPGDISAVHDALYGNMIACCAGERKM
jgi:hypothetical protein